MAQASKAKGGTAAKVKGSAAKAKPKGSAAKKTAMPKGTAAKRGAQKRTLKHGAREGHLDRWAKEAEGASTASQWTVPWFVLMQEAADASAFVKANWKSTRGPRRGAPRVLGLDSVKKLLPATIGAEIRELQAIALDAHGEYLLRTRPKGDEDRRPRADHVLSEITAALEFLFDDGVEDERDAQLAEVESNHEDAGSSNAAVASALEDYGALARAHLGDLDGLGGFDSALLDEVAPLAKALRGPVSAGAVERSPEAVAAIERRNRHANLLLERIKRVRRAAQYVFRSRPEVVRKVTSTYLRRKRAAARRARVEKGTAKLP